MEKELEHLKVQLSITEQQRNAALSEIARLVAVIEMMKQSQTKSSL